MQDRVLLAVSPEVRSRLGTVLAPFDVTQAFTAAELRAALATRQFDLVVVGTHFEESKALEVIQEVRHAAPNARIVCVRGVPFMRVGKPAMDALRLACEALGAAQVIDLLDYPDDEAGNRAIRELFERELAGSAPSAARA